MPSGDPAHTDPDSSSSNQSLVTFMRAVSVDLIATNNPLLWRD